MDDTFDIEFYIRPRPVNKELVSTLVEAVTDLGSIYDEAYWSYKVDDIVVNRPLEEAICAVSEDQGDIWFLYNDMSYWLSIHPHPTEESKLGYIAVRIDHVYLDPNYSEDRLGKKGALEKCLRNAEQFLEIAKAIWNVLEPKPIYGFGDYIWGEGPATPTHEEILNLKVEPHIYRVNFFGPELVEKFGKKKLLSVPAYKVEELKDGVMFLRSPLPYKYGYGVGMGTYKEICEHFGWKTYFVYIFDIERWKPKVKEYGVREKEFRDINTLKEYLERDIEEFRSEVKEGKVFVMLETPSTKPVPEHVKEMERWLREKEVKVIRW